jgi:hypothetical protein
MTRNDYEKSICDRMAEAVSVPYRGVSFADGSTPVQSACHDNADRWVKENPEFAVARGWVTFADYGLSVGLTAHSVVRDSDGQFLDITPLGNERDRAGMRFIPHVGTEQEFRSMKISNIFIECPRT